MGKGKGYKPKEYEPFESDGYIKNGHHKFVDSKGNERTEYNIGITTSMMFHPAYLDLTPYQRELYRVAKYQYRKGNFESPSKYHDNEEYKGDKGRIYIYLNEHLVEQFRIYAPGNHKTLYKDIKALIEHGFIIPYEQENNQRWIYKLIDEWKNYTAHAKYQETNPNKHTYEWVTIA